MEIKEVVALSTLGTSLRNASLPEDLNDTATEHETLQTLEEIAEALQERASIVQAESSLIETVAARNFLATALYDLEYMQSAKEQATSNEELVELANEMIAKIEIEFYYAVVLTHEEASFFSPGAAWSVSELESINSALESLPEGLVLTTPLLTQIQRVSSLGEYVMGQRFPNGLIRIADFAVDNDYVSVAYEGLNSLEVTLVHEIGHSVQLGADDHDDVFSEDRHGNFSLADGDKEYDFHEFMEVSGWKVVDPDTWELSEERQSVIIDDRRIPIGVPVVYEGEQRIFTLDQGILYSHDTLASFSLIQYSRTNPWEDWAEGFAEYILLPERLIEFAPEKFEYFEQELRVYQDDPELLEALSLALEKTDIYSTESELREAA